ncbi:unnamed protein product, partial [marine sediment metagenome]
MEERISIPILQEEESGFEFILRPQKMAEFVGQNRIKENLGIFIQAAKQRGDALDHTLLYGPPGLGKTTLAYIIANEMEGGIQSISGSAIDRPG